MARIDYRGIATAMQTQFRRANAVALTVVATIAVIGQLVMTQLTAPFPESNARMRVAAQQAVTAQTIGNLAQRLAEARSPSDLYSLRANMAEQLRRFSIGHRALAFGDGDLGINRRMSAVAHQAFFGGENSVDRWARDMEDRVRSDLIGDRLFVTPEVAADIAKDIRQGLNPALMAMISQYAEDAQTSARGASAGRVGVVLTLIAGLIAVGQLVHRPTLTATVRALYGEGESLNAVQHQHDGLTGLPNRTFLRAFVTDLCQMSREHNLRSAVLHLDLKGYSDIKSDAGMPMAERILCMAARRIESVCRSGDFVARVGGDEFVIIAVALDDDTALNDLTDALRTKLAMDFHIDGRVLTLGCNIGICYMDANVRVADSVLNHAEIAMDTARGSNEFDVQFYQPNMKRVLDARKELYEELAAALNDGQIHAHFQPVVALDTGALIGMEALLRWHHPARGVLTPVHFIDVAETFGLMPDLTRQMLANCLNALAVWDASRFDVPFVAINLGAELLTDDTFLHEIKWAADSHDIAPDRIAFEIAEQAFEEADPQAVSENIRMMSEYGFHMLIDDFGTGHLDASQLKRLAVGTVKIDRAFVTNIDSDAEQQSAAAAMIQHARATKLAVIAEGVETPAERAMLLRLGCHGFQGFLLAEPMSVDTATSWLDAHAAGGFGDTLSA